MGSIGSMVPAIYRDRIHSEVDPAIQESWQTLSPSSEKVPAAVLPSSRRPASSAPFSNCRIEAGTIDEM